MDSNSIWNIHFTTPWNNFQDSSQALESHTSPFLDHNNWNWDFKSGFWSNKLIFEYSWIKFPTPLLTLAQLNSDSLLDESDPRTILFTSSSVPVSDGISAQTPNCNYLEWSERLRLGGRSLEEQKRRRKNSQAGLVRLSVIWETSHSAGSFRPRHFGSTQGSIHSNCTMDRWVTMELKLQVRTWWSPI